MPCLCPLPRELEGPSVQSSGLYSPRHISLRSHISSQDARRTLLCFPPPSCSEWEVSCLLHSFPFPISLGRFLLHWEKLLFPPYCFQGMLLPPQNFSPLTSFTSTDKSPTGAENLSDWNFSAPAPSSPEACLIGGGGGGEGGKDDFMQD